MVMEHYTATGEKVEENDPNAAFQVRSDEPEKQKVIDRLSKLSNVAPPARASTLESPNYGTQEVTATGEKTVKGTITSNVQEVAKEAGKPAGK